MKNHIPKPLSLLLFLVLFTVFSFGVPAYAVSTSLVVSEVYYDANGTEPDEEWFEIYNLGGSAVDLTNYKAGDEETQGNAEGMMQFPAASSIAAGQVIVVANKATAFNALYGFNPDYEMVESDATVPNLIDYPAWATGDINIANSGDEILILDGSDTVVDGVGYGTSTFFTPGVPDVVGGHSVERNPADVDTDSSADWIDQANPAPGTVVTSGQEPEFLINEVDSDTASTDTLEFIELHDGGVGDADLSGLVVVFFNGSADTSYAAYDLDGFTTDATGYFTLGNAAVTPTPGIVFADNTLQNGADAVALYTADASDFPSGTAVTTTDLVDALVYDTDDADDSGLLVLLNAGQPQINENGQSNKDAHSSQRCPNGAGGARNSDTYDQNLPTPQAFNTCGPIAVDATIMEIQGTAHLSPLNGLVVNDVAGIVTAVATNGFYLQDAAGDGDVATSDALFVFTSSAPTVLVGDSVTVDGSVSEFYPGGIGTNNLATTEIVSPIITVISGGNPLPAATVIGIGGRIPPMQVIDSDACGEIETCGTFGPTTDGLDFYESMEAMLVQVNAAQVVGPTNRFGEIGIISDMGVNAGLLTPRGGIVIQSDDYNPERMLIDDKFQTVPDVDVGDLFTTPITGVVGYSFGMFKLEALSDLNVAASGLISETAPTADLNHLSIVTFNVENLDPLDDDSHFDKLANEIVNHLKSPDIIALQEIQDNNGPTNDGVVDASTTYNELITAVQDAGGPTYDFRDIAPVDDQDGGEPGGNIRVGYLYRADRGLAFVDRPGGDATTATTPILGADGVELTFSPGRVDPTNAAFLDSRKPLAAEFTFNGHKVFVINNHFNSKGGDDPLFGRIQPPVLDSEAQRIDQAQVLHDFVDSILALDADANVIVLGDLNDFPYSAPINTLEGTILTNLIETLPLEEQYTYIFEGNSQVLDHILVTNNMTATVDLVDVVHANAEFDADERATDHDQVVAHIELRECESNCLRSAGIQFKGLLQGGQIGIRGSVVVVNENGQRIPSAMVGVTWTLPDGSMGNQSGATNSSGVVHFMVMDGPGTYTLTINNIAKPGGMFDPDNSVLSNSVTTPTPR